MHRPRSSLVFASYRVVPVIIHSLSFSPVFPVLLSASCCFSSAFGGFGEKSSWGTSYGRRRSKSNLRRPSGESGAQAVNARQGAMPSPVVTAIFNAFIAQSRNSRRPCRRVMPWWSRCHGIRGFGSTLTVLSFWVALLARRGRHFSIDHISQAGLKRGQTPDIASKRPLPLDKRVWRLSRSGLVTGSSFLFYSVPRLAKINLLCLPAFLWVHGDFLPSREMSRCYTLATGENFRPCTGDFGWDSPFCVHRRQLQPVCRVFFLRLRVGRGGIPPGTRFLTSQQTSCPNPLFQLSREVVMLRARLRSVGTALCEPARTTTQVVPEGHAPPSGSSHVERVVGRGAPNLVESDGVRRVFGVSSGGCGLPQWLPSAVFPGCCCCVCCPRSFRKCSARAHRRSLPSHPSLRVRPSVPAGARAAWSSRLP